MRVLDLQTQMKRSGVIRLGEAKVSDNQPGKRLSTFRLTSNDKSALEAVARLYGGTVTKWEKGSQQWQVTTRASELPIEISNMPTSTQYEYWRAGVCERRCNGCSILEGMEAGKSCQCPADPKERALESKRKGSGVCTLSIRMWVRLPEVPDIGVWQVTSHSFYAAKEMPGTMDGIEHLAKIGAHLRARLAIDIRKSGSKVFPVLTMRLDQSEDDLRAIAMHHMDSMRALEGADEMTKVAFKLGLPMTVVDGKMVPTVRDSVQALPPATHPQTTGDFDE